MARLSGDKAYYLLKRVLENVIDGLGVDEILELVETVRRENVVDKRYGIQRVSKISVELCPDEDRVPEGAK